MNESHIMKEITVKVNSLINVRASNSQNVLNGGVLAMSKTKYRKSLTELPPKIISKVTNVVTLLLHLYNWIKWGKLASVNSLRNLNGLLTLVKRVRENEIRCSLSVKIRKYYEFSLCYCFLRVHIGPIIQTYFSFEITGQWRERLFTSSIGYISTHHLLNVFRQTLMGWSALISPHEIFCIKKRSQVQLRHQLVLKTWSGHFYKIMTAFTPSSFIFLETFKRTKDFNCKYFEKKALISAIFLIIFLIPTSSFIQIFGWIT